MSGTGDLHEQLAAISQQIACNHAEVKTWIFGGPDGPGIDGRLRPLERDVSVAKKAIGVLSGGMLLGAINAMWDTIKKKIGIG